MHLSKDETEQVNIVINDLRFEIESLLMELESKPIALQNIMGCLSEFSLIQARLRKVIRTIWKARK